MEDSLLSRNQTNSLGSGALGTLVIGGDTYLIAQPTEADMFTLHKRLMAAWKLEQSNLIASVAKSVAGMPASVQEIAIRAAVESQAKGGGDPAPSALSAMLLQPKHTAFWVWVLARKNHPDLKLATVEEFITAENQDEILSRLFSASSMADLSPNSIGATGSA